jgi:hypothetical protein
MEQNPAPISSNASICIEHLARVEDFEAGEATYRVAMTKGVTIQDRQDGV